MKINKNVNFTKLAQKGGISLIVLVITIIVIIILAAAVILTINNNNPVAEANKARYESDRANIQAIFTNAVAKVMTHNRATVSVTAGQINTDTENVKESVGEVTYTVTNAMNKDNTNGKIVFKKGNNTDTTFYTGKMLPIYAAGETKWYVDEEGNITLEVAGVKYGEGEVVNKTSSNTIYVGGGSDENTGTTAEEPLATFEKALELVKDGGTIVLVDLVFTATPEVTVSKSITIKSEGGVLETMGIFVTAPNLTVEGAPFNAEYGAPIRGNGSNILIFNGVTGITNGIHDFDTVKVENSNISSYQFAVNESNRNFITDVKNLQISNSILTGSFGVDNIISNGSKLNIFGCNGSEFAKGIKTISGDLEINLLGDAGIVFLAASGTDLSAYLSQLTLMNEGYELYADENGNIAIREQ